MYKGVRMNIHSILKKEGIEIKSKLNTEEVNSIANIIAKKICETFPEHNLKPEQITSTLSSLTMYIAKMPANSSVAKYFPKNNSIYFSDTMNLENLDTLAIHECIHAIQEVKKSNGKLVKLGLYDVSTNHGQGINEASVQLMASRATNTEPEAVKYYNMDFPTESPLYYPLETALITQISYFTGSYPLFHSTLYSDDVFKNTLIAKSSKKVYQTIEYNFDLLIYYEEQLSIFCAELTNDSEIQKNANKIKKLNQKIANIKSILLEITLSTQNLILENCFRSEFNLIKDQASLNHFQERLYDFNRFLIRTDSDNFYNTFYCEMMSQLEGKRELIKKYGVLNYLNDLQTDLLDLQKDTFGLSFFRRLFAKLKLTLEEAVRQKT